MKYPERIDKHITESSSYKIFSNSIPDNWIVREVTERDYGIDCYVEIVNKKNEVTGELVSIQLKGKRDGIKWTKSDFLTFSGIKISTTNYWNNFPTPVFICLVDVIKKEVYFCPVKSYIRQNIIDFDKQDIFSYRIQKKNKLDLILIDNFLNSYLIEKDLNLFEREVITFVSSFPMFLDFINQNCGRDHFMGIEHDRILYLEHFYNNLKFLCSKFNIAWNLHTIDKYKAISIKNFGDNYSLYENEMSQIVTELETKMKPILLKIKVLIWGDERDFWLNKNNDLFNIVANTKDDGTFGW